MKPGILLAILLSALPLSGFAAGSDTVPAPLRAHILQLIAMTGGTHMGELFGNALAQQFINNLKASHPDIPPKAYTIVQEETGKVMSDPQISKQLTDVLVPIYARYYTDADVRQMIAFYKTPLGKKIIQNNPAIAQASMQDGEQWGRDVLAPELLKRIRTRFQQEGIKLGESGNQPPR